MHTFLVLIAATMASWLFSQRQSVEFLFISNYTWHKFNSIANDVIVTLYSYTTIIIIMIVSHNIHATTLALLLLWLRSIYHNVQCR